MTECANGEACGYGPDGKLLPHPICDAQAARDCQAFAADVVAGIYNERGFTPNEWKAYQKKLAARAAETGDGDMAKRRKYPIPRAEKVTARRGGRPRSQAARAQALPGMEDHAIKPLEDIAAAYAEIRDKRMELTRDEHDLKGNALRLMKKYNKTIYRHGGVEITVVTGDESVKVKIKKPGEEDEDAPANGVEFAADRDAAVGADD